MDIFYFLSLDWKVAPVVLKYATKYTDPDANILCCYTVTKLPKDISMKFINGEHSMLHVSQNDLWIPISTT